LSSLSPPRYQRENFSHPTTMSYIAAALTPSPVAAAFPGIQWDPLGKLNLNPREKSLLRNAEHNPIDYTLSTEQEAKTYSCLLLRILSESLGPTGPSRVSFVKETLSTEDAMQILRVDAMGVVAHYVITKLYEVITCLLEKKGMSVAATFYNPTDGMLIDEWRPLLRVLHLGGNGDAFAQRGAAVSLAYILMAGCPSQGGSTMTRKINYSSAEEPLQALISWITSQLQSSVGTFLSLVTPTLTALMNCPEARLIFSSSGGIGYLCRHLRIGRSTAVSANSKKINKDAGASVQQLYELCFCLWTMTYECNSSATVRAHFARDGAVNALVDLVSSAPREKVVRVALSALRNLAICSADASPDSSGKKTIDGSTFLTDMIGAGLLKNIDLMRERQWTDPDLVDDVEVLYKLLHENFKEMSRWDVYKSELESGHLEWGILHSEKFFKENAKMMEGPDGDFFLLKMLIALVGSDDEEVAAIACFDIGEFVRHYPNGRSIAKRLGAKDIVMKLIEHENEEVQRHALQSVSKMMVQNWAAVS